MRAFPVMAAELVGFLKAVLYSAVSDAGFAEPFTWKLEPWPLTTLDAISAIAVGLAISGAFLRFARRDLQGGFFARYHSLMVMAIYIGGVALSLLLTTVTISLDTNVMGA